MSGASIEVAKRSRQTCWRRRARASAKVVAGLGYQVARRGDSVTRSAFLLDVEVTNEYRPNSSGVVRKIGGSDH
jgi:hypothetical protein